MRSKMGVSVLSFLGVSLVLTATGWAATLPGSCGPNDVSFTVSKHKGNVAATASSPEKATLVFVQRAGFCIGCSTTRLGLDGAWVGANKGSSYFAIAIDPGEHHVCADWGAPLARTEAKIGLEDFQAEAGKSYYFETLIVVHEDDPPRMILKPLSPDMGAFLVSRSEQSVAAPKTR